MKKVLLTLNMLMVVSNAFSKVTVSLRLGNLQTKNVGVSYSKGLKTIEKFVKMDIRKNMIKMASAISASTIIETPKGKLKLAVLKDIPTGDYFAGASSSAANNPNLKVSTILIDPQNPDLSENRHGKFIKKEMLKNLIKKVDETEKKFKAGIILEK